MSSARLGAGEQEGERWLYDLSEDPGEGRDVSDLHPEVLESLGILLQGRRAADEALQRRYGGGHVQPALDPQMIEELRSLGYLDSGE